MPSHVAGRRRSDRGNGTAIGGGGGGGGVDEPVRAQQEALVHGHSRKFRDRIHRAQDDANELQFNAFILSSFQVEVLFVLCTLLGGRRKVDAQRMLASHGVVPILDEMFDRLSWGKNRQEHSSTSRDGAAALVDGEHGVHGPGCECNPEKALRIQYLRLLHNFCDRECDSHMGRQQLLSDSERAFIHGGCDLNSGVQLHSGLLTKVITAFRKEPEDSDCRFWLATCSESWLRGSSPKEQTFCAKSGLLRFLVDYVLSNQLYCSGRLQTAFDLLGELCKGNTETLYALLDFLDEDRFERLMNVAVSHLVDSNVFIRALLLSVERILASNEQVLECSDSNTGRISDISNGVDNSCKGFLTHTWRNIPSLGETDNDQLLDTNGTDCHNDYEQDDETESEWFSPFTSVESRSASNLAYSSDTGPNRRGDFGWRFDPRTMDLPQRTMDNGFRTDIFHRLARFLILNQAYLLKELLNEVDLRKINHENICCLNTAILISVFAYRRGELAYVVKQLRAMNDDTESSGSLLTKFRELLWFWSEYYTHRGRDRLSLEFSSHLRFQEWKHVVDLLCADNRTSATCLNSTPIRLPKSPYRRAPRSPLGMFRTL